ncbi:hypothetical protein ACJJTC_019866 [Scirpophaga incertulas]
MQLMFVLLFLLNSYLGCDAAPTTNATLLSSLLTDLLSKCENEFLKTQIKNKLEDCAVLVPPYHEKQFECLLFYDINRQLCNTVHTVKLDITPNYGTNFLGEQDVSQLCSTAKDWNFTDLGVVYNKTVNLVFQDTVRCARVCSANSEDLLNIDSTFYCKYFKWGSDILKTHEKLKISSSSAIISSGDTVSTNIANTVKVDKPVVQNKLPELGGIENANLTETKTNTNITDTNITSVKTVEDNSETAVQSVPIKLLDLSPSTNHIEKSTSNNIKGEVEHHDPVVAPKLNELESDIGRHDNQKKSEENKQLKTNIQISNGLDVAKKSDSLEPKKDNIANGLLNQLENPKPKDTGDDDYQINDIDSEEVHDGLSDTQGDDDGDEPSLTDLETKVKQELHKKPVKNNEVSIYNNDISQKEIYPNSIPEAFGDDDDHFFPFFLTAIIMVVLLYVLYHNKNKVSKVVLGLIVEGRQSGRRRNSRGHAYRRLDTLEQAMSANSAAPPSKIIY